MNRDTMTNSHRSSQQSRMSIESGHTFSSLMSKELFEGEEYVEKLFAGDSRTDGDRPSQSPPPMRFISAAPKRPSALEYEGGSGELFCGNDLAEIFQQQQDSDRDTSMRMSFTSFNNRRHSNISRGNDRRGSVMSLMSLADCSILENPSQLVDTLDTRDNFPTSQEVEENKQEHFNNNNNENSQNTEEDNDRIEYIEKIGPYDIVCGRNNGAHNWVGNRRFKVTVMMQLKRYTAAPTREEKTHVIKSVIELLTDKDGVGARFIKKVGNGMYERLKDKQIREKVGHAFRDMMSLEEMGAEELEAKCFR